MPKRDTSKNKPPQESEIRLTVGYPEAQKAFRVKYKSFVASMPNLQEACNAAVAEISPRIFVDRLIYYQARLVFEDFNDIVLLVANGRAAGAMKILRGMFERAVTAEYLRLNPEMAQDYWDYYLVSKYRETKVIKKHFPGAIPAKDLDRVEAEYRRVKRRYKRPTSWIDKSIVEMAEEVSKAAPKGSGGFKEIILHGYYYPMQEVHSTVGAILRRTRSDGKSFWYEEGTKPQEDEHSLLVAHYLIIRSLVLLSQHFGLDTLEPYIKKCLDNYKRVWQKKIKG